MFRAPFRALASMQEVGKLAMQDSVTLSFGFSSHEFSPWLFLPPKQGLSSSVDGNGKFCTRSLSFTPLAPFNKSERSGTWKEPGLQIGKRCMSGRIKDPEPQNGNSEAKENMSANSDASGGSSDSERDVDIKRMVDFTSGKMLHRAEGLKGGQVGTRQSVDVTSGMFALCLLDLSTTK